MNKEKALLITGSTSDIAFEYLKSLSNNKIKIIALYRNDSNRLDLLKIDYNLDLEKIKLDLFDTNKVKTEIVNICEKYDIIKVLHIASPKVEQERFNKVNIESFEENYKIQFLSIVEILKVVLSGMKKNRYGKVVFILSSCTLNNPPKFLAPYITTKYALLGLMKCLVSEYKEFNIQINSISPTMIDTKFLENLDHRIVELNSSNHPLKRNLKPSELVDKIEFLFSESSQFINGINLNLSGGENY